MKKGYTEIPLEMIDHSEDSTINTETFIDYKKKIIESMNKNPKKMWSTTMILENLGLMYSPTNISKMRYLLKELTIQGILIASINSIKGRKYWFSLKNPNYENTIETYDINDWKEEREKEYKQNIYEMISKNSDIQWTTEKIQKYLKIEHSSNNISNIRNICNELVKENKISVTMNNKKYYYYLKSDQEIEIDQWNTLVTECNKILEKMSEFVLKHIKK